MAEEFQAGICGETWWNPTRTVFTGCNSPLYTTGIADIGSFGWGNDSTSQVTSFGLSSPTTSDWNQSLFRSTNGRTECFDSILQDDTGSRLSSGEDHQGLLAGFPIGSASYDCPSTLLQTLLEPEPQQQSLFNDHSINYMPSAATYSGAPSIRPPLTKQQPAGNLQFSNNTSFWNTSSTGTSVDVDVKPGFSPSSTTKINTERVRKNPSSVMKKGSSSSSSEAPLKRSRHETPSPLPTFKVRKEKLGDRITALQQLVSPFGKTDTASVLHEAIEYIKFLHDQVNNADNFKDKGWPKQDLRSRGLCLVPLSSTFPLANETPVDFWTPTFGSGHPT